MAVWSRLRNQNTGTIEKIKGSMTNSEYQKSFSDSSVCNIIYDEYVLVWMRYWGST
jgi:hypothetical protein